MAKFNEIKLYLNFTDGKLQVLDNILQAQHHPEESIYMRNITPGLLCM